MLYYLSSHNHIHISDDVATQSMDTPSASSDTENTHHTAKAHDNAPGREHGGERREGDKRPDRRRRGSGGPGRREKKSDYTTRVVSVRRVTKVVKGGKNMSFSALVVIGDGKGRASFSYGKAKEVADAVRKATNRAEKLLKRFPIHQGRTIHHDIEAYQGASKVLLRPSPKGTGVRAGTSARAVCEAIGYSDISVKCFGSRNPGNVIAAVFDALSSLETPKQVSNRRQLGRDINANHVYQQTEASATL